MVPTGLGRDGLGPIGGGNRPADAPVVVVSTSPVARVSNASVLADVLGGANELAQRLGEKPFQAESVCST